MCIFICGQKNLFILSFDYVMRELGDVPSRVSNSDRCQNAHCAI